MTAPNKLSHRQVLVVFTGLMLGLFLAALDQTVVSTALPTIVGELGGLDHLSWVVTAYLLTSTASSPLYGKVSDLYGRRIVFQVAIVIFLIGSVLAGAAQSMAQLIAFRAIQGLGAGGLIVMALTIIGDILSPRERGRYQGYVGSVFALSSVAGPLVGGFFTDHLTWRWVFYINLPIGIIALIVTTTALNLPFVRRPHRVDYPGAAVLVIAVSSLLLVTVLGGSEYAWGSAQIVGLALLGVVLTGVFLWREHRAAEPILPLRLFRNRTYSLTGLAGFVLGLAMFGGIVFLPLFLQVVTGATATNSGLLILPLMAGMLSSSILSGRLISRTGRYKRYPVAGMSLTVVALLLLSTMDASTSRPVSSLYMLLLGVGIGLVMQVLIIAVQNAVEHRDLGVATSTNTFFRSLGGAFGTAVFGAILSARLLYWLPRLLPTGSDNLDPSLLLGSPEQIRSLDPAVQAAVVEAVARSVSAVFLWAVPIAVVGLIVVVFIPELPLRDTAHVGAHAAAPGAGEAPPIPAGVD
ncbi:MAG TPA: MDR family MFS transporter [Acidimicrobiia bacterium]|nr:MDR family MFS transporter [Acidimicrobiia bacterium]